jgi:hypothetical protein
MYLISFIKHFFHSHFTNKFDETYKFFPCKKSVKSRNRNRKNSYGSTTLHMSHMKFLISQYSLKVPGCHLTLINSTTFQIILLNLRNGGMTFLSPQNALTSVADPGCLSRIQGSKAPDPGSVFATLALTLIRHVMMLPNISLGITYASGKIRYHITSKIKVLRYLLLEITVL